MLNPKSLLKFLDEKIRTLGTAACPPYHLAIVIGGTSAEMTLKTVKLASCRYLDTLPTEGNRYGQAFRDRGFEQEVLELTRAMGIGAQFGGKYFCHDVRVIRLPRHGASVPIGIGVSCSADRQILGKITAEGVFLEELETNPARFLPEIDEATLGGEVVRIDLNRPMAEIRAHPVAIPDQDAAQPDRAADRRARHRACETARSGSIAARRCPTTSRTIRSITPARPRRRRAMPRARSGRPPPAAWIAMSTRSWPRAAALSRSPRAIAAPRCARPATSMAGSISARSAGPAARLAQDCIKKVEVIEYPELGMEAIWRIEVENFPAFIVIDDKGNDFFAALDLRRRPPGATTRGHRGSARETANALVRGEQGGVGGVCAAICWARRGRRAQSRPRDRRDRGSDPGGVLRLCRDDFRLLRSYDPERAGLSTWITIVSAAPRATRCVATADASSPIDAVPEAQLAVDAVEPVRKLKLPEALLSPRQREILTMLYDKDMEVAEIAAQLGIDPQTVRSAHHKAMIKLRAYFKAEAP